MKRKLMMLVAAIAVGTSAWAQDMQTATLQNAEGTQVFYGANALTEAAAAANHGDVIKLSAGSFLSPGTLSKAVKLYGAGSDKNDASKLTIINNDVTLAIDTVGLYVEGIYFSNYKINLGANLSGANFVKCRMYHFNEVGAGTYTINSLSFIQCRVADYIYSDKSESFYMKNCVVNRITAYKSEVSYAANLYIENSIILGGLISNNINGTMKNSIYYDNNALVTLSSYMAYFNCLSTYDTDKYTAQFPSEGVVSGCWRVVGISNLWASDTSTAYSDTATYELTEEAKATYIGTDGTEIGIYGGETPYNLTPTIPYIISKDIPSKSTDGKLKVNIKVAVPTGNL